LPWAGKGESDGDPRESNGVGEYPMVEVHENQGYHSRHEAELDNELESEAVAQIGTKGRGSDDELHKGIARRDGRPAMAAASQEQQVAQDGNVVIRRDRFTAAGAARAGTNHGLAAGQAMDDHVDETPQDEAEGKREDRPDPRDLTLKRFEQLSTFRD